MEMEEFEYSVEICDRDWDCFFAECEECNLLPPSLAGVDDSGMSDIDDTGSILAKRVQKVDLTTGFSEDDHPIDGPPDCEGSPVEYYLSKHGVSGMESVLSGSEEDIHLQCVNLFFERLKKVTGAERLTEPSQVSAVKTREIQEEARCSDGKQASSTPLPKNIPELNSLPARGEPAFGKETTKPVNTIGNIMKTMKKEEPGSNMSPEPAASNSVLKTNKSVHPEAKALIIEEACTETRLNDETTQSQSHDSPDRVETRPHTDKVIKVEMCTPLDDVKQEDWLASQVTLGKKCSTESSWSNLEMGTNIKRKEDPSVSQSDAISTNKTASQESSPSTSIRRKRRKKRRLSAEPADSVHGYERQDLVKPSDSEEEQFAWRGGMGLCVSKDFDLFHLNEPQQNVLTSLTTYSTTSNLPVKVSAKDINVNDLPHYSPPSDSQYQNFPERIVRQGRYKAAAENNAAHKRSVTPLSQTEDSGDVAAHLQPCRKLQVDESPGLSNHPGSSGQVQPSVSFTDGITGKSDLDTETIKFRKEDAHVLSLRLSDKLNRSCAAEVKPLTRSDSSSAESSDPMVEGSQIDKLSAAKSVLAEEAGNSGRDKHTLCQREAEHRQQLEIDCHCTDQYSSSMEKTRFPLPADGLSSSDAHNTKPKQLKTRACPVLEEISTPVDSAELTLDTSKSLPDKCCLSKSPSSLDGNVRLQQTEDPLVLHTLSKCDVLSEKNATTERAELAGSQIMAFNGNPFISGEISLTGKSQRETKMSTSEDVPTSPSDITPLSSCCTLDTESGMSLSGSSCLSVSQNDCELQGEKTLTLAEHKEADGTSGTRSQAVSNDATPSTCDLVLEAEDVVAVSKAGCEPEPDSKCSVFTMSSFWSEMEKLTINDILGLRMISRAAPPSSLPPLQESEEADVLAMTDSGVFTHLDESKPEQNTSGDPNSLESSSGSSRDVMWESEPVPVSLGADIYTENMMLTSCSDISQPVLDGSSQTCFRKICKNVSVHNLHALESFSYTWKGQTLQTLDEGELEKVEYFPDGHMLKQDKDTDCSASSSTDSYRISLTDIFQYLFGGKQSNPSQPAADNITTCCAAGNSVPETYDQFFSEFDTESFFYPLITAEDQAKGELVPVFSCSRSANRNLQFPEAYDYFFASLSSDDSSVESDEEDNCGPVRVVNRFNRTLSASKFSTDIYENFFTDSDLRQNLFWKNTLSFRNISLSPSTVRKQTLSNPLVPVSQSGRSLRRTIHPLNALGNQDMVFSDPLLHHLEDRISRQLAQQPFRYEDLQTAVSNPRLDASFLPLRQSDMCLVCIAFASWVLKTANPQVGDAWKAVLLANVSALSAIRYLRKYVKMEAAASEKKLHLTAPSDS